MSPPVGWHLGLENGVIRFYKNGKLMVTDDGKEYGSVTSVAVAKVGNKELLRVSIYIILDVV